MKKYTKIGIKLLSFFLTATFFAVTERLPVLSTVQNTGGVYAYAANTREPANPVHRHDAAKYDRIDDTDWSYVYFGSYSQTEVTGDDLISDITGASYDENGDAWVNDTKYRRISAEDTNNGAQYWDDRNVYRYFKWERIKWRVMQNNGSTLFLVADNALDHKAYITYNESGHFYDPVTWEISTLRQWLNSNFYAAAFSNREQELIVEQTLTNEDYNDT